MWFNSDASPYFEAIIRPALHLNHPGRRNELSPSCIWVSCLNPTYERIPFHSRFKFTELLVHYLRETSMKCLPVSEPICVIIKGPLALLFYETVSALTSRSVDKKQEKVQTVSNLFGLRALRLPALDFEFKSRIMEVETIGKQFYRVLKWLQRTRDGIAIWGL